MFVVDGVAAEAIRRAWHEGGDLAGVLKDHRRLSLRLGKTDISFRAFACFAAALMNLRLKLRFCL